MKSRVRVDPIACEGHGVCAELLPERIELDDWGYPIVSPEPVSGSTARYARRAVNACPTLALLLEPAAEMPEDRQRLRKDSDDRDAANLNRRSTARR